MLHPPAPLAGARLLFSLDPSVAYLNHGSFGAVPIAAQRVQQRLRDEMEANPMRFLAAGLDQRIAHTRRHLAAFLGADPDGSALVDNATTGASLVLASLDLEPGEEIVTTNHGYGGVTIAVQETCRRTGAVHREVELPLVPDDRDVVKAIVGACSARTKLVVVDAITSVTARVLPVAALAAELRGTGTAVFVDAAHAPGLLDTAVTDIGADFWVGNLHKWAFAPRGTALLAVGPAWRERVRPLVVSWYQPDGFPANVEVQGARDYTPWLAAPAGLFVLRTLGLDVVREHNAALAAYGQRVVADALGVDAPDGGTTLPMRLVPLPDGHGSDLESARALRKRISDELATEVAINPWHGQGLLRLSAHVYNRAEEYERLAEALPGLLRRP